MKYLDLLDRSFSRNFFSDSQSLTYYVPEARGDFSLLTFPSTPQHNSDMEPRQLFAAAVGSRIVGTNSNDKLRGTSGDDKIIAKGGTDLLVGAGGNDLLNGGSGNDRLVGGGGNDNLVGGAGNDVGIGGAGNDRIVGGGGDDRLIGGSGNDAMFGSAGNDVFIGGGGNDRMVGGGGNDRLIGGGGNDVLIGNTGNNNLFGGGNNDNLFAGNQDSTLDGGAGNDVLVGGAGVDVFVFRTGEFNATVTDRIINFQLGGDKIDARAFGGVTSIDDLEFGTDGTNVTIVVNGGRIILQGIPNENQLSNSDFLFSTAGTNGPNTITGGDNSEVINGQGGNDVIGTSGGTDTLIGGTGADRFVIRLENGQIDPAVDSVQDFSLILGDVISLKEALSGIPYDTIEEVFRTVQIGADTMIQLNIGSGFQNALRLLNVNLSTEVLKGALAAPAPGESTFVKNPYGFSNDSYLTADPAATSNGEYIAFVSRQNIDSDAFDLPPDVTNGNLTNSQEREATQDVFRLNTGTGVLDRVTERVADLDFRHASAPAISENGRFVAYVLEEGNTAAGKVYVRDMLLSDTPPVVVSIDATGAEQSGTAINNVLRGGLTGTVSNESVSVLDISADGNRVAFVTTADLTGAGETDSNNTRDVYVRDIAAGTTTLVSKLGTVAQGTAQPYVGGSDGGDSPGDVVKISQDGRYVAFTSRFNFNPNEVDSGEAGTDLYLADTATGNILLVSSLEGGEFSGPNSDAGVTSFDISADGSTIVFATKEAIAANDTNELADIYVAKINFSPFEVTSRERVSEAEDQFELFGGHSYAPTISADGKQIAFLSQATDFLPFDPDTDFDRPNGDSNERFYVLDLETRQITVPTIDSVVGGRTNQIPHAVLTDQGLVYRIETTAAPGGNRAVSDTIAITTPVAPVFTDVPGGLPGTAEEVDASNAEVQHFSSIRSVIDFAGDVDVFAFEQLGSGRTISVLVEGVDGSGGTLSNPMVTIHRNSPTGTDIGTNETFIGQDVFLNAAVGQNQNVFFRIESSNGGTGSYRITIAEDAPPAPGPALDEFIFDI